MKVEKRIKTIVYLPLTVAMASLAHALSPTGLFFLAILVIAFYLDLTKEFYISGKILTALGILLTLFFFTLALRTPFEAIAYWIMSLSIIKILGKKAMRDLKQIVALSFFNFVDSAIFHYSFVFLIYLVLYIVSASIALLIITFLDDKKETSLRVDLLNTLRNFGIGFGIATTLMSLFFFIILPRSPYVLLRAQIYSPTRREGFGNELQMGRVEYMNRRDQILMRVKPLMKRRDEFLYIRGNVYNVYKKETWIRDPENLTGWNYKGKENYKSKTFAFQITLEPMSTKALYVPNYPEYIDVRGIPYTESWGKVFLTRESEIARKVQYKAFSSSAPDETYPKGVDFLSVPEKYTSLIDSLIEIENLKAATPLETAQKIKVYFLKNFQYSLEIAGDTNWVNRFLKTRKGHCEYFATLAALILRRQGIPSRIVAGYLTKEWNLFGNYFIVRTKHAHTWVEYYFNNQWLSLDPTPPFEEKPGVLSKLSEYIDYLSYLWTTQVLEFSFSNQIRIFNALQSSMKKLFRKNVLFLLGYLLALFILTAAITFLIKRSKERLHPATFYYRKFEKILKSKGYKITPAMTSKEIANLIKSLEAIDFLDEYNKCRFSGNCDLEQLKRKFENFRRSIS
ncbi:MAG: DUF3488 and transglutaminase-like domain-containing protein [candidate division WOR-3 bacterium]